MKLVVTTQVPVSVWHVSVYRMICDTNALHAINQIALICEDGAILLNNRFGKLLFGLDARTVANIKVGERSFDFRDDESFDLSELHKTLSSHFLASPIPQILSGRVTLTGQIEEA